MLHINDKLTYDECEAAMCLWEECLNRLDLRRKSGGYDAMEQCDLWNWLRGGEGAASARDMCMQLAKDIELSYKWACEAYGFDDSFDWEFIPRWANEAMEVTEYHQLDDGWNRYIAYKVTEDWRTLFDG